MNEPKPRRHKRTTVVDAAVFVSRLRELMEKKGLSAAELADRADLARSAMTMFFTGDRKPSADALVKLSEVLDVTTDYLLGRSNESTIADLLQHEKVIELVQLFISLSISDQMRVVEMVRLMSKTVPTDA